MMIDLLERIIKLGLKFGVDQIEVFGAQNTSKGVYLEKSEPKMSGISKLRGVGIRVIKNKHIGFSYTTDLSEDSIKRTIKTAINVANIRGKDYYFESFQTKSKVNNVSGIYFKRTNEITLDELSKILLNVARTIREYDKRITSISAEVGVSILERYILNSLGVELNDKQTTATAYAYAVAEENGKMTSGYDIDSKRNIDKINTSKLATKTAKMSIDLLSSKKIEPGKADVLLEPIAVSFLFSPTLLSAIRADNVQEKRSFLIGKINNQIATNKITVVDNALTPEGLQSRAFDDEGVPSRKIIIVEKGVLKNYLYNLYTAQREGRESTGHGSRSITSEPTIAPTNFEILTDETKDTDEIITEVRRGVIANSVIGGHTSNPITGEFSVALGEAFYIENGEIKFPIRQAMMGGNVLDLLKKIEISGKEKRQIGSIVTGTLLFKDIMVSG